MGKIDTMILTIPKTAAQAFEKFGDKVGKNVKNALSTEADANDMFNFIQLVRPRKKRERGRIDVLGLPFESYYVGEEDQNIIEESGYPEFPFHVPRWTKGSSETYGRGVGTEILPQVRILQRMMRDLIECGDKWNAPPMEVLDGGFNGNVEDYGWKPQELPAGQRLQEPKPLFSKLDDSVIEEEARRIGT